LSAVLPSLLSAAASRLSAAGLSAATIHCEIDIGGSFLHEKQTCVMTN